METELSSHTFVDQPQRIGTSAKTVRPPLQMSETPPSIRRGAPGLGEHSAEILSSLGYDDSTINALIEEGTIAIGKDSTP